MKQSIISLMQLIADQLHEDYKNEVERQQIAWWMLEAITGKSQAELLAQQEIELTKQQEIKKDEWLAKVVNQHMPIQYLLGSVPFNGVDILVKPPVLIPRPETEEWTIKLINQLTPLKDKKLSILELATGSGAIGIALAKALPNATLVATDISDKALSLAKNNAKHNKVTNIKFIKSDVWENIPKTEQFDLIVVNPPYVTQDEWNTLDPMVTQWEDRDALVASQEGLAIIKEIIDHAKHYLQSNSDIKQNNIPELWIEIGYKQGPKVKELMEKGGFNDVTIHKDLEGKDRVVTGRI